MAELKVLRTYGKDSSVIEQNPDVIQLFITALQNCETKNDHEFGDFLIHNDSPNKFALIVKDNVGDKMVSSALRVSILNLFKHLLEEEREIKAFVINRYQFMSKREEIVFISVMREFLMTYFGEVITEPVHLIISEYKS